MLQTLALIQRHADEPREVARLARGQERELRNWLYRPEDRQESKLAAALEEVAGEVEDTYAVQVESVVVGDAEVDDRLGAVVQATREALVNAARHAGVGTVSLYAEVEPEEVTRVRPGPRRRLRPGRWWRTTGTACAGRSSAGWSGTAGKAEIRSTARRGHRGRADHGQEHRMT